MTVDEFLRFRKKHEYKRNYSPTNDCPVGCVSWYDAFEYCNWLSEQEKLPKEQWCYLPNNDGKYAEGMTLAPDFLKRTGYRLPTEGEWEYACRAGSDSSYSFGASVDLLGKYGWFAANALETSHPGGLCKPNDLGLFDMCGNQFEWCQDKYLMYSKTEKDKIVIVDSEVVSTDAQPRAGRIMRGGCVHAPPSFLRSAFRRANQPTNGLGEDSGFRLARTLPPISFSALPQSVIPSAERGENKKMNLCIFSVGYYGRSQTQ